MTGSLIKQTELGPKEIDILKVMSRAALEYIGRGGLGHSFGPLNDERSTLHSNAIKNLGYERSSLHYFILTRNY